MAPALEVNRKSRLQALVYEILPSTTAVFSYAIGSRKLSANEQFFVGAQTVVSLLQTTQIMPDVSFITDHVAYASSNQPKSFESKRKPLFTRGGCASCLRAFLGARLLPQSYQYPNLSEGADRVDGQLRGDKECPLSGVTKSGRVWRKVPESGVRSVQSRRTFCVHLCTSLQCHFMQSHVRRVHVCVDVHHPTTDWFTVSISSKPHT